VERYPIQRLPGGTCSLSLCPLISSGCYVLEAASPPVSLDDHSSLVPDYSHLFLSIKTKTLAHLQLARTLDRSTFRGSSMPQVRRKHRLRAGTWRAGGEQQIFPGSREEGRRGRARGACNHPSSQHTHLGPKSSLDRPAKEWMEWHESLVYWH
jgi:hypothetical protein